MPRHGEAANSNKKEAEKHKEELCDLIKAEVFVPQQVLNGDETGLFVKKLPNRTFIKEKVKASHGHVYERQVYSFDVWQR